MVGTSRGVGFDRRSRMECGASVGSVWAIGAACTRRDVSQSRQWRLEQPYVPTGVRCLPLCPASCPARSRCSAGSARRHRQTQEAEKGRIRQPSAGARYSTARAGVSWLSDYSSLLGTDWLLISRPSQALSRLVAQVSLPYATSPLADWHRMLSKRRPFDCWWC